MRPRLVTIPISHYCEKARWALDRAGIDYEERRHLQVFHYLPVWMAARGISAPAFRADGVRLADSTDILHWVDEHSSLRLYPTDEALALEERFDEELGPASRRMVYFHLLQVPETVMAFNNAGAPAAEAWLLTKTFALARSFMKKRLEDITAEKVADDAERVRALFAEVSGWLADGRRYLSAGQFTAADLTFASLAAPVVIPDEYGIPLPPLPRLPAELAAFVEEMRATPAGAFALRMFREERRPRT